jgi:hypothetical protein
LDTYKNDRRVAFQLVNVGSGEPARPQKIEIPLAIVYRLYFLGRAFDGQAVKNLQPDGKVAITYNQIQQIIGELELVSKAVSDPVSLHYIEQLIPFLKYTVPFPNATLLVEAP